MIKALASLAVMAVFAVSSPPVSAQTAALEKNASVVRTVTGAIGYRALSDGHPTGRETFMLTVHPDGSRVMRAVTDIPARAVEVNVTLRADANLRPLDASILMFRGGVFRGGSVVTVRGSTLTVTGEGPNGPVREVAQVPEHFSIATHPLSLDGWHGWYLDPARKTVQTGAIFLMETETQPDLIMRGKLQPESFLLLGTEEVTVPAGTFTAQHLRMGEDHEIWVTGPDRILVRYIWKKIDREYVLTEFAAR